MEVVEATVVVVDVEEEAVAEVVEEQAAVDVPILVELEGDSAATML